MENARLHSVKRALLREVDRMLWQHYRQSLDEVLNDLAVRRFLTTGKPSADDTFRILNASGVFETVLNDSTHDLRDALRRIEGGTFGLCLRCGRDIPVAVLEREPTTRYCAACQLHEKSRQQIAR